MSDIRWSIDRKSKWHISQNASRFAYHYCLACSEDGAPENWKRKVRDAVSEAVPEDLGPYLMRYLTQKETTITDLIRAGLTRDQADTIRQGRRRAFYMIADAYGFVPLRRHQKEPEEVSGC